METENNVDDCSSEVETENNMDDCSSEDGDWEDVDIEVSDIEDTISEEEALEPEMPAEEEVRLLFEDMKTDVFDLIIQARHRYQTSDLTKFYDLKDVPTVNSSNESDDYDDDKEENDAHETDESGNDDEICESDDEKFVSLAGVFEVEEENNSENQLAGISEHDPPFICYLLNTSTKHNCMFLVGDPSLNQPLEQFGVHKILLMAHSKIFHLMLKGSDLVNESVIKITDIQPDTFRNLLRFVYGYNNISKLTMEEAVNLVYVAEKYVVEELKPKLSKRICSKLSIKNVCIPLQKQECFQQKPINDAIIEIIQNYTDVLIRQKNFLKLNTFGILCILQQDTLSVTEIELWKSVLKWSNHNVMNSKTQRELLNEPLKYIRMCTLTLEDFCKEVFPSKILTDKEVTLIIESIVKKNQLESLTTVCNTIETRNLSDLFEVFCLVFNLDNVMNVEVCENSFISIRTHSCPIVLVAALFESLPHSEYGKCVPKGFNFFCECQVTVTKITDYRADSLNNRNMIGESTEGYDGYERDSSVLGESTEGYDGYERDSSVIGESTEGYDGYERDSSVEETEFVFGKNLCYGEEFEISLASKGHDIELSAASRYRLSFKFLNRSSNFIKCFNVNEKEMFSNRNKIELDTGNEYKTHVKGLTYKQKK